MRPNIRYLGSTSQTMFRFVGRRLAPPLSFNLSPIFKDAKQDMLQCIISWFRCLMRDGPLTSRVLLVIFLLGSPLRKCDPVGGLKIAHLCNVRSLRASSLDI